jgi:hypothetical protein
LIVIAHSEDLQVNGKNDHTSESGIAGGMKGRALPLIYNRVAVFFQSGAQGELVAGGLLFAWFAQVAKQLVLDGQ